jgi:hypothetical protein
MTNFAVLNANGEVINTIVADSLEIANIASNSNCVELPETGFGIGDSYDGVDFIRRTEPEVTNAEV